MASSPNQLSLELTHPTMWPPRSPAAALTEGSARCKRLYHVVTEAGLPACGTAGALAQDSAVPAEAVGAGDRCTRHGCAVRWESTPR